MLDIVAADQKQPAASVDAGIVDNRQPRLPPAQAGTAKAAGAESADRPGGRADQAQDDYESEKELNRKGHTTKKAHRPPLVGAPPASQWLTTPETFAAANTNKELKSSGTFAPKRGRSRILMVNGGLMAKERGEPD
ncbi:MAG: hypothetical protein ACRECE_10970 [Xanthobacteraceae bacterium]